MGGGRDEEIENLMTLETERNYYVKSQNHGFFFFFFFHMNPLPFTCSRRSHHHHSPKILCTFHVLVA